MKTKTTIILSIFLSIISIAIIVIAFIMINKSKTQEEGIINIYVEGKNGEVLFNKEVPFYENEHLIDVLNRNLTITEGTFSNKGMIVGINDLIINQEDDYYFKILVNCEFATSGAWNLELHNKDSIRIIYSSFSDFNAGC